MITWRPPPVIRQLAVVGVIVTVALVLARVEVLTALTIWQSIPIMLVVTGVLVWFTYDWRHGYHDRVFGNVRREDDDERPDDEETP
jgi:uncharacterized membrane protein